MLAGLNKEDENRFSDNLFYVFVKLPVKKDAGAEFYLFSSREVTDHIKAYNQQWIKTRNILPNDFCSFILKENEQPNESAPKLAFSKSKRGQSPPAAGPRSRPTPTTGAPPP
jgi:hypothetical protein